MPILEMRKQRLGQVRKLPKVMSQDSFVFKTLSPEASLSLEKQQQSTRGQAEGEECFSLVAGTMQLQKYCLHSGHTLTHTKHLSPFLTDASPGAGGDKPRAHLTGISPRCVFQGTVHGPCAQDFFQRICPKSF